MIEIEGTEEKQQFFTVRISRKELLAIVAISGNVGGDHPVRWALENMADDAATLLDLPRRFSIWEEAQGETNVSVQHSLYLVYKRE